MSYWIVVQDRPVGTTPGGFQRQVYAELKTGWFVIVDTYDDQRPRPVEILVTKDEENIEQEGPGKFPGSSTFTAEGAKKYLADLHIEIEGRSPDAERLKRMAALVRLRRGGGSGGGDAP